MKIATRNINECVGITTNLDNQETTDVINTKNIDEIIDKINEYDFDVICFQEYPTYINEKISLTDTILNETNLKYFVENSTYNSFLFDGGKVGVSIFSKYKIKDSYKTLFFNPKLVKQSSTGDIYHSFDK
jgi:endonuclease/exonuclease/phosphatase family metal-dependent hydrolase